MLIITRISADHSTDHKGYSWSPFSLRQRLYFAKRVPLAHCSSESEKDRQMISTDICTNQFTSNMP